MGTSNPWSNADKVKVETLFEALTMREDWIISSFNDKLVYSFDEAEKTLNI